MTELWSTVCVFLPLAVKPSYATFVRVFHERGWKDVIYFRSESKHAKCNDCEKLKQYHRCAFSKSDADLVLKNCHFHLSVMMQDRKADARFNQKAIESVKDQSSPSRLLSFCIDGMDVSKFKCPLAQSKQFESMRRPACGYTT